MSASKEAYGLRGAVYGAPLGARSAAGWKSVAPTRRCPVCGSGSWCQVLQPDAAIVLCHRVPSALPARTNSRGEEYHVHVLGPVARQDTRAVVLSDDRPDRATPEVRDRAYRALLAQLHLDDADRAALHARGLDDVAIEAAGYRSLPERGRAAIARAVVASVGDVAAWGVPGIVRRWRRGEDPSSAWPHVRGFSGVLIPVRDLDGRIVALKVRRRDAQPGQQRYLYLTSSARDDDGRSPVLDLPGPSAESAVHVPIAARAKRRGAQKLIVTEGELKADVTTALSDVPTISIPGVGAWSLGAETAHAYGAPVVCIALDMDFATNEQVARARQNLYRALRRAGLDARLWTWDSAGGARKGIDDYIADRRRAGERR